MSVVAGDAGLKVAADACQLVVVVGDGLLRVAADCAVMIVG